MLKKKIIKKVSFIVAIIITIFILNIFPSNNVNYSNNNDKYTNVVYLLDSNDFVSRVTVDFNTSNVYELIPIIFNIMTVGSDNSNTIRNGFKPCIPKNTKLLNFNLYDNILHLNLSKDFLNTNIENERKIIEAIIYTFTSFDNIDYLDIDIENNDFNCLPISKTEIPLLLDRSFKINKEININNINKIDETVIFYMAKNNDYTYYIPVTKYTNNNDNDKIDIIIEELKSSTTINENLISYLNNNTLLINHEISDSYLLLNFNNQLLNIDNKLIEEVTYAINLSVDANYKEIKNVIYYIDNNLFKSYSLLLGCV